MPSILEQNNKKHKNQQGMTMIVVLIVIFVFSVLGVTIWQYSMNNVIRVQKNYKQKQAYYIARSGVEALSSHILSASDTVTLRNSLNLIMNTTSSPISIGSGTCTIALSRTGSDINIKAVGTIDGESAEVELGIKEKVTTGFPLPVFKNAVFSDDSITLNGIISIIGGTLESNGAVKVNGVTDPSYVQNSVKNYPKVIYPVNLSTTTTSVPTGNTLTISDNSFYNSITVESDGILKFQLNGSDLKVVIDNLTVKGELIVSGTGRLILYSKKVETKNNGEINIANETQPITSFLVLMPQSGIFNVGRFRGLLYAPGAEIKLIGSQTFKGAMVGGKVTNSDNPTLYYLGDAGSIPSSYFDGIDVVNTTSVEYSLGKWK